jgi:hypothetical protein
MSSVEGTRDGAAEALGPEASTRGEELKARWEEVLWLHRTAQVPWDDVDTNALRSGRESLRALVEALKPLDPDGAAGLLEGVLAPSKPIPEEMVLTGEPMHRFFVQLAVMTAEELLMPEVKRAVAKGMLPVPDAIMSNSERMEEMAKLRAVEAAMEAASRAWQDVFVDAPPPPVALHDLPTLLRYLARILDVQPGSVKATNSYRSI